MLHVDFKDSICHVIYNLPPIDRPHVDFRGGHAAVSNLGVKGPGSSSKKLAVMPSTQDITSL